MTAATLTLAAFIADRLSEDEAYAESGRRHNGRGTFANDNYGCLLIDPARVLATVAAHRAILAAHELATIEGDWDEEPTAHCSTCTECCTTDFSASTYPCPTLRALAAIWADHDLYRAEEWAP